MINRMVNMNTFIKYNVYGAVVIGIFVLAAKARNVGKPELFIVFLDGQIER